MEVPDEGARTPFSVFAPSDAAQPSYAMKPSTLVNARYYSSFWLPVFLVLGGLLLAGCTATAPTVGTINTPDELETGESGTFEATIENQDEVGQEELSYSWEFGDESGGSGLLTNHVYNSTGKYTVTFTASNSGGADSASATVQVVRSPKPASISSLNATPNPAEAGERVRFSSNVQGATPIGYSWSFGDDTRSSGSSPSHTYNEPGTYDVELAVSNRDGTDSRSISLEVESALPEICTTVSEFNSAFFGRNSSTLTDEAKQSLNENADILNKCPNLTVRVEGFAAPGERNSQSLSNDRAQAVADYYADDNGIDSNRINTSGEGAASGVTSKKGGTRQFRRADSIPQR